MGRALICSICRQERASLKFRTGRLSICHYCVRSLNETTLSPRSAEQQYRESLRAAIVHKYEDGVTWVDKWLEWKFESILDKSLADPSRLRRSPELKVIRAYRRGLICIDRKYLDFPEKNHWDFKRYRLKHAHGYACYLCQKPESDTLPLDAHHIIWRSHSGTNNDANLVILCRNCHKKQHKGIAFGEEGGEPRGSDIDLEPSLDDACLADIPAPPCPSPIYTPTPAVADKHQVRPGQHQEAVQKPKTISTYTLYLIFAAFVFTIFLIVLWGKEGPASTPASTPADAPAIISAPVAHKQPQAYAPQTPRPQVSATTTLETVRTDSPVKEVPPKPVATKPKPAKAPFVMMHFTPSEEPLIASPRCPAHADRVDERCCIGSPDDPAHCFPLLPPVKLP